VAHGDTGYAARAPHRAVVHWKDHRFTLRERHHHRSRLRARPLFDQHELAAGEILARDAQQDGQLQREDQRAVQVLVKAVEIILAIAQQQRRWLGLARCTSALSAIDPLSLTGIDPLT
jgi:hypothetical protein